ncbi:MAG: Wadjet anti-phage system protein JetD domain-containing protein [Rhodoferax sp.]|uniref:Wadjet anti-phage system protein JetD domain-containing protein n=1 Tax=Rhodoferax sp. TaxID=50421 RepID=UPI003BB199D7
MSWTRPADLRTQTFKLWDKGDLLRALIDPTSWSPRRLRLVVPDSNALSEQLDAVRAWLPELQGVPQVRLVWRAFTHRLLGASTLPAECWLDTLPDALGLIGKTREARRFEALLQSTRAIDAALFTCLLPWLSKRPLAALALADDWPRLLSVLRWLQTHPRPGIYLRQVDLAGVDSKFIESQRGVLTELLDLCLPPHAIDASATGAAQFCRRFGFRDKPLRIRLRVLDAALALPGVGDDQDITLTQADFAQLALPVQRVFITENEVNFLAFPPVAGSVVIFGAGYGFDVLGGAAWLQRCSVYYWGDLDSHGFAILDQLRAHLPHAQSLLMDAATLHAHRAQWVTEPAPALRQLTRLSAPEAALCQSLITGDFAPHVALVPTRWPPGQAIRLEQERLAFGWVQRALAAL